MTISKLTWGVKASFRGYVEAAGGSITLGDGATRTDDGSFVFNALPGGDLSIASDGLMITVAEAPANQSRCAIAKLFPIEFGSDGKIALRSEITMDGMWQIADNYPPGTELDPVEIS